MHFMEEPFLKVNAVFNDIPAMRFYRQSSVQSICFGLHFDLAVTPIFRNTKLLFHTRKVIPNKCAHFVDVMQEAYSQEVCRCRVYFLACSVLRFLPPSFCIMPSLPKVNCQFWRTKVCAEEAFMIRP